MSTGIFAPGSFRVSGPPLRLDFSGTSYQGLEVTARRAPLGLLRDAASVTDALGRALVSWNVRDGDGHPVPADPAGLASRDPEFTAAVAGAWLEAVAGELRPVPAPRPGATR